jgi:predicted KAP-like P-loop ATPase
MQTDRPIRTATEDRFDRAPFAKRIAEVIRTRRDPSTLVIGLYGPWGDGKSSTLSLIREALSTTKDVVEVEYNPWFFSSNTENLTRSFFLTIGDALEKTALFSRERVGALLRKYGGMVPKFGGFIKAAGDALSVTDLKATRAQVEAILDKHKTPIVVFVDDIDRLDRK